MDSEDGIWIAGDADEGVDTDLESDDEEDDPKHDEEEHREQTESEISEEGEEKDGVQLGGRFGALAVEEQGTEDSEDSE